MTAVNRLREHDHKAGFLVPIDPERHALERRIEHAKERIAEDLRVASALFQGVATRAGRGAGRLALLGGVLVAGAILVALRWRAQRRIRITWR